MDLFPNEMRLGDVIDDFCVKCRRLTNHSIVSIVENKAAKVRCRTCYNDHDYRFEQAPPSKKDLKKAELFKEVLASVAPGTVDGTEAEPLAIEAEPVIIEQTKPVEAVTAVEPPPAKRGRGRTKKTPAPQPAQSA